MEEIGIVVDETDNNCVVVEIERKSACSSCGLCTLADDKSRMRVELRNDIGAKKGDKIIIEAKDENIFLISFVIYVIPIIFFIAGLFLGHLTFGDNYILVSLCCIMFLFFGFFLVKVFEGKLKTLQLLKLKSKR